MPAGLNPAGSTPLFSQDSIPEALQREHALAPGRWGILHVFSGAVRFVDLESGRGRVARAPDSVIIPPLQPHRLVIGGELSCRIDFFMEPDPGSRPRTPGSYADDAVRQSFARCDVGGEFGERFYEKFLAASPEVAAHFAESDLARQRQVLSESVRLLVESDVAEAPTRAMLERLGQTHSRGQRNVRPELYELWLECICAAAAELDPQWGDELDRKWRVRLRPGMQLVMAAY